MRLRVFGLICLLLLLALMYFTAVQWMTQNCQIDGYSTNNQPLYYCR